MLRVNIMARIGQVVLVTSFLLFSWLAMQIAHELGHVAGAGVTGGTVRAVVLHPLAVSRTDVSPNPSPLVEVWAGAVVGCALPVAIACLWTLLGGPRRHMPWFFAGFCLVANGIYIGVGSFYRAGDAGQLMALGAPQWALVLFGVLTALPGLYVLHKASEGFGFGSARGRVAPSDAVISVSALAIVVAAELLL